MLKILNRKPQKTLRKKLRNHLTPAEKLLWIQLKGRKLNGHKFRRQQGIGNYIVDFYCPKHKLVIEVDGDSHYWPGAQSYDRQRQSYIESHGISVLRFKNTDIYSNLTGVLERILRALQPPPACQRLSP